ncbi:hypothetical protein [Nitrosopumilus sp.]|uniref:hypothetical protein n=1 Tax=Nitrosopumilus sp. TaxID=2024843 RepID=UPI0026177391|nr:hypothetical protein [Nitrosopumilus sp.]
MILLLQSYSMSYGQEEDIPFPQQWGGGTGVQSAQSDAIMPDWFKSNAKWWKNGLISDADMINALESLMIQDVIPLDKFIKSSSGLEHQAGVPKGGDFVIPSYQKDVFGFWSDGIVSDGEIVNSIGHLMSQGIINSEKIQNEVSERKEKQKLSTDEVKELGELLDTNEDEDWPDIFIPGDVFTQEELEYLNGLPTFQNGELVDSVIDDLHPGTGVGATLGDFPDGNSSVSESIIPMLADQQYVESLISGATLFERSDDYGYSKYIHVNGTIVIVYVYGQTAVVTPQCNDFYSWTDLVPGKCFFDKKTLCPDGLTLNPMDSGECIDLVDVTFSEQICEFIDDGDITEEEWEYLSGLPGFEEDAVLDVCQYCGSCSGELDENICITCFGPHDGNEIHVSEVSPSPIPPEPDLDCDSCGVEYGQEDDEICLECGELVGGTETDPTENPCETCDNELQDENNDTACDTCGENIVTGTTDNADGSTTTYYDDGSSATTTKDGVHTTRYPDGTTITTYQNGNSITTDPNGVETVMDSAGNTIEGYSEDIAPGVGKITTYPDGMEILQYDDGFTIIVYPDGTRTVLHPNEDVETNSNNLEDENNISRVENPNGTVTIIYPDGTTVLLTNSGTKATITYPDSSTTSTSVVPTISGKIQVKLGTSTYNFDTYDEAYAAIEDIVEEYLAGISSIDGPYDPNQSFSIPLVTVDNGRQYPAFQFTIYQHNSICNGEPHYISSSQFATTLSLNGFAAVGNCGFGTLNNYPIQNVPIDGNILNNFLNHMSLDAFPSVSEDVTGSYTGSSDPENPNDSGLN